MNPKKENKKKSSASHDINDEQLSETIASLEKTIQDLEKKSHDAETIAKRAQSEYVHLKMDMDAYRERAELAQKEATHSSLIQVAKRILPFVSQLKLTIENMPEDLKDNSRAKGVVLLYTKSLKDLEQLSLYPIETLWKEPDFTMHIPVATEPTDDDSQKGKIIKELEEGYVYNDGKQQKVVLPAKVIVGA